MQTQQIYTQSQEKPLISFILTYYNLPVEMLQKCIDSILTLAVNTGEREIIVVDDGSENSPVSELMKYGDEITYIRQRNMGLSEARNKGIQMATGEYLQFVDADDLLVKAGYDYCIGIARDQQPEMILFDFTSSAVQATTYHHSPLQSGSHYMRHHNLHGTACGYLFRRTILGELRFTAGIYHEDEEFTPLLLLRAETVCVTNAQAYFYQQRDNSIITKTDIRHRLRKLNDLKGVISRLHDVADHRPVDDRTALQRRVAQLTMDYLYQIILQTNSRHYLDRKIAVLRREGLFPLPDQNYSTKYTWFRRMTNSAMGRRILLATLPLMKKER